MRILRAVPKSGPLFFGTAMASLGLIGLGGGRFECAALAVVGTALCVTGVRLRIAAAVDTAPGATHRRLRLRPLERAVQCLWAVGAGAAMALGVSYFGAGQQEAGVVYLMCAVTCVLGLAIQSVAADDIARHAR